MTADRKDGYPSAESPFYDPKFEGAVHPNFHPVPEQFAVSQQIERQFQPAIYGSIPRGRTRFETDGYDAYGAPEPKFARPARTRKLVD